MTLEILASKDVCLSGKNCKAKKQKLPIRYMYLNIFDLVKCPCPIHTYSYECGANYCTRDQISCERVKNGWKMNNVNKCGNENIILIHPIILYAHILKNIYIVC